MNDALKISDLTKRFDTFTLGPLSFTLPRGAIMGFIGENGAGKSTTMKLILNLMRADGGTIEVLGMDHAAQETAVKKSVGVVSEATALPAEFTARMVGTIHGDLYEQWDDACFNSLLARFDIDPKKRIMSYSKGMRMKLSIACALSHNAELLLLDEPTSGLDPIVRGEVLDLLREYMNDERSILLSSHITSDLEHLADYISFIHQGRLLFTRSIEELRDTFAILHVAPELLHELRDGAVLAVRRGQFVTEALVDRHLLPAGIRGETATLDQIMLFLTKGAQLQNCAERSN